MSKINETGMVTVTRGKTEEDVRTEKDTAIAIARLDERIQNVEGTVQRIESKLDKSLRESVEDTNKVHKACSKRFSVLEKEQASLTTGSKFMMLNISAIVGFISAALSILISYFIRKS